ncbi:MAG: hypothetical protein ACW967_06780 [Candidatus Hodarchaeales archaeon]|jgi:hypothetical protein
MLNLHIYGFLKKKFDPNARMSNQTIIKVDYVQNETFIQLLNRLDVNQDEIGDCFVNGKVVTNGNEMIIPDESRIGLFGVGMVLIESGEMLKKY